MEPYERVVNHKFVTDRFGYWPSFHDAEILSMSLDREPIDGDMGPSLMVRLHAWEMTGEIEESGDYRSRKHAIVTFEFDGIDGLTLHDFNHQNVIACLDIVESVNEEGRPILEVDFHPIFGAGCLFRCVLARVKTVESA